jgi:hypothetical protein
MELAHDCVQWWASVLAVLNLQALNPEQLPTLRSAMMWRMQLLKNS